MTLSSRHGRSRPDPGQNTDFGPAPSTDSRAGRSLGRTNTTARARSQSRHHEQQHLNLPDPSSFPLPPQRPSIDPSPSADPRHSRVVLVEKKDHRYDAARKAFSSQENDGVEKLRIYMGDSETYNMVPHPTHRTNAKDIILTMQDAGMMKGWVGSGEWMLWEVWKELGVERPIRTFEVVGDVVGAWGKLGVTGGNRLIAKISGLAPVLSRSALPSSAPMCSGYVDFEAKRGKWVKKWLMLRENAVYVAKRENAKEELLCSLSNFDAYIVTRAIKAPKPFTFALKSTDDLSFFEDKSDYMHLISCDEKTGGRWMERVLLARSFVLYQEKSTLFTASNGAAPTALSRSGTTSRKRAPTLLGSVLPSEPPIPPPMSHGHGHGHGVFEPGSLLGRQQAQRV
ncbi:hypothetical protein BDV98DRAFT_503571 [Pterulicium gracile]|uniref:PH domain-containing protein n=1 Tax=Pterulicium gracile TaxID=1884261 RepID=A0A5C3QTT6_9AGAR|nr:hypothetical protein BDV98DRAFT_503571 [Pterula gracilis]